MILGCKKRKEEKEYLTISKIADDILTEVLREFKKCADEGVYIETSVFLHNYSEEEIHHFSQDLARRARRQHETQDIKLSFQTEIKKLYKEWENTIINDEFFSLLDSKDNRDILIRFCSRNNLSIDILPRLININWKGTIGQSTAGYYFVHKPSN